MTAPPVRIAVVGHTNAGKTSLMRTLTRRRRFGEVSSRPATTRHVEMAEIGLEGKKAIELFDTPGLEDSTGLLAYLDAARHETGGDWTSAIEQLIASPAGTSFEQEAKALAQLRQSDVALYVIDARDKVRAKHRDELEVLGRCAVPILPVLNFVADPAALTGEWRSELARKNMHAIVAFDTVVFDEAGEDALYAKIGTMLDRFAPLFRALSQMLKDRREEIRRASAKLIADLLIDAAAARRTYQSGDAAAEAERAEDLKKALRKREAKCVKALIALQDFSDEDYATKQLPIEHGEWREDPFDPATLARFGLSAGKAAATGAAAGLAVDLMTGGLTLGVAALAGAAAGFLFDTVRKHGGGLLDRLSGTTTLTIAEATLKVIAMRELALAVALLHRGHGAMKPIDLSPWEQRPLPPETVALLRPARREVHWSSLNGRFFSKGGRREELRDALADRLRPLLAE